MSELPSSEDLDPSTGTDAPTPPTTTGPSSYTLNWEEPSIRTARTCLRVAIVWLAHSAALAAIRHCRFRGGVGHTLGRPICGAEG